MTLFSMATLNHMDRVAFTQALGTIFEDTPTIAAQAWERRPFLAVADLERELVAVVRSLDTEQKLKLIRAHPDLGSKAKMAVASVQEQSGVGLDRLSASEADRFQCLNQAYRAKFDFPFIIAVKHHPKSSILAAFEQRLQNTRAAELERAIAEICQIARFRLEAMLES